MYPVNIVYVWDLVVISPVIIFCVYSDVPSVKVVEWYGGRHQNLLRNRK